MVSNTAWFMACMQLQLLQPCDQFGPGVLAAAHAALDLALGILQALYLTRSCCCVQCSAGALLQMLW